MAEKQGKVSNLFTLEISLKIKSIMILEVLAFGKFNAW
jgi:hypothetical protein